ncbi:unnamed protein product [Amoebophrya sp. A120]|nr:unnamed protein product [Amoebophrya sp. A120]|eukprot:GSA120T00001725001.1
MFKKKNPTSGRHGGASGGSLGVCYGATAAGAGLQRHSACRKYYAVIWTVICTTLSAVESRDAETAGPKNKGKEEQASTVATPPGWTTSSTTGHKHFVDPLPRVSFPVRPLPGSLVEPMQIQLRTNKGAGGGFSFRKSVERFGWGPAEKDDSLSSRRRKMREQILEEEIVPRENALPDQTRHRPGFANLPLHQRSVRRELEWNWLLFYDYFFETVLTTLALFFAGILASASGIGGGGIFVVVLMFCNDMSPHQAVPLSKAIIFGGAMRVIVASCGLTVEKLTGFVRECGRVFLVSSPHPAAQGPTHGRGIPDAIAFVESEEESPSKKEGGNTNSVFSPMRSRNASKAASGPLKPRPDMNVVCAVVPQALAGTVFGVLFNVSVHPCVLVVCLAILLSLMAMKTFSQGIEKWREGGSSAHAATSLAGVSPSSEEKEKKIPLVSPGSASDVEINTDVVEDKQRDLVLNLHSSDSYTTSGSSSQSTKSPRLVPGAMPSAFGVDLTQHSKSPTSNSSNTASPVHSNLQGKNNIGTIMNTNSINRSVWPDEDDGSLYLQKAATKSGEISTKLRQHFFAVVQTLLRDKRDETLMAVLLVITILAGYRSHLYPRGSTMSYLWISIPVVCSLTCTAYFYRNQLFRPPGSSSAAPDNFYNDLHINIPPTSNKTGYYQKNINKTVHIRTDARSSSNGISTSASPRKVMPSWHFPAVATFAGIGSGLFGIGGGLIFSPFFLHMGIDPATAIATSASCVVFTSTSTTFQYMFLHRIMMPYALWYGTVSFFSAIVGAKFLAFVRQQFGPRGDAATILVVATAVVLSATAAIIKVLVTEYYTEGPASIATASSFLLQQVQQDRVFESSSGFVAKYIFLQTK